MAACLVASLSSKNFQEQKGKDKIDFFIELTFRSPLVTLTERTFS